jgi:hypothetical protein
MINLLNNPVLKFSDCEDLRGILNEEQMYHNIKFNMLVAD